MKIGGKNVPTNPISGKHLSHCTTTQLSDEARSKYKVCDLMDIATQKHGPSEKLGQKK